MINPTSKERKHFGKWILARVLLCIIIISIPISYIINAIGEDFTLMINYSSDNILVERWVGFRMHYDVGGWLDAPTRLSTERRNNRATTKIHPSRISDLNALRLDIEGQENGLRPEFSVVLESLEIKKPLARRVKVDFADIFNQNAPTNHIKAEIIGDNVEITITGWDPFIYLSVDEIRDAADTVSMRSGAMLLLASGLLVSLIILLIPASFLNQAEKKTVIVLKSIISGIRTMTLQDVVLLDGIAILCFINYRGIRRPNLPDDNYNVLLVLLAIFAFIAIWTKINKTRLPEEFSETDDSKPKHHYYYLALLLMSSIAYIPAIFPDPYYNNDEFQVIEAAMRFLEGNFTILDLLTGAHGLYTRAWPHTLMVSAFFYLFGVSTVSGRALSAIFGIIFIVSTYYIFSKMTKNRNIAFVTAALLLVIPDVTMIFRTIRMYAVLLPATIWMVYFVFNALTKTHKFSRDNKVTRLIKNYFDFHYGYLILTIAMVVFIYIIHPNGLITGFGIVLFIVMKSIMTKEKKYKILSLVIVFLGLLFTLNIVLIRTLPQFLPDILIFWFPVGTQFHHEYYWMNLTDPWGFIIGTILMFTGVYFGWRYREKNDALLFISLIQISSTIFLVFFADRYVSFVYLSFLFPFTVLLIVSGLKYLSYSLSKTAIILGFSVLSISLILNVSGWFSRIYVESPERPKYSVAVEVLKQDAQRLDLDVIPIEGVFVRLYYFKHAGNIHYIPLPHRVGARVEPEFNTIIKALEELRTPVGYSFYYNSRLSRATPSFREFLLNNANILFDDDNVILFRYHFIAPSVIEHILINENINDISDNILDDLTSTVRVTYEADGNLYNHITANLIFNEYTSKAQFLSVRVTEVAWDTTFSHYFQLLIPDDFALGQELVYEIPIQMTYSEGDIVDISPINYYFGNGVFYPEISGYKKDW